MFYSFRQNNSGGRFVVDENVAHLVVIEANDADEARRKARDIGIYFNGCRDGRDCSCCGDRWDDYGLAGEPVPSYYGDPLRNLNDQSDLSYPFGGFFKSEVRIHYADGRVLSPKSPDEVPA